MSKQVPEKVYIIHNSSNPESVEYSGVTRRTAKAVDLIPEMLDWPAGDNIEECWKKVEHIGIKNHGKFTYHEGLDSGHTPDEQRLAAESVTLSHIFLWDKIQELGEAACIVEHDFVFKNNIPIIIPDGFFVGLGYKLAEHTAYKNELEKLEDKPREIVLTRKILGAHGYAITPNTAKRLLEEVREKGVQGWVDCVYFQGNDIGLTNIMTSMLSPPPGVAWLRKSTIWENVATMNYKCIDSFTKRCKSEYDSKKQNELSRHHFASIKMRSV